MNFQQLEYIIAVDKFRNFVKASEGVKTLIDRDDADVVVFQIAGNIYKALEQVKECEKLYKNDTNSPDLDRQRRDNSIKNMKINTAASTLREFIR